MAFSILPDCWATTEAWLVKSFILLGVIIIGPWLALIGYDFILYVVRVVLHSRAGAAEAPGMPLASAPSETASETASEAVSSSSAAAGATSSSAARERVQARSEPGNASSHEEGRGRAKERVRYLGEDE